MADDNSTDNAAEGKPLVSGNRDDLFGRVDSGDDSIGAVRAPGRNRNGRSDDADSTPLLNLAERMVEHRARSRVTNQRNEMDELFESVEIGEPDHDDVWMSLVKGSGDVEAEGAGVGAKATPTDDDEGVADHVVPKSKFCQCCEHFTAPPELAYHHEGMVIVELEGSDHSWVRSCPTVERDD